MAIFEVTVGRRVEQYAMVVVEGEGITSLEQAEAHVQAKLDLQRETLDLRWEEVGESEQDLAVVDSLERP